MGARRNAAGQLQIGQHRYLDAAPPGTFQHMTVELVGGPLHGWHWPLKQHGSTTLRFPKCVDLYFGSVDAVYDRQPNGDFHWRGLSSA